MVEIYSRFEKESIDKLIYKIRRNSLDKTKVIIELDEDLFILNTRARCYINSQIFSILDYYKIPKEIRKEFIYDDVYTKSVSANYMNKCLNILSEINFDNKHLLLPHILADIKSSFVNISIIVNGIVSADHNMLEYARLYRKDQRFRDIFEKNVFELTDDPWTIKRKSDAVINLFKNQELILEPITEFLKYGIKVNSDQILMFFCYSMAPNYLDVHEVLPPLATAVIDGVKREYPQLVFDMISRLAIYCTKSNVKDTGVQSKLFSINMFSTKINMTDTRSTLEDCHSHIYLKIDITNEKDLRFFSGKYYYDNVKHVRLGVITKDRKDLIGKTLHIRTFAGCYGEVVCKECYGVNWEYVADTEFYKGNLHIYILQEFNRIMQQVISLKHHSVAILKPLNIGYNGVSYEIMHFIETHPELILRLEFNKLVINPEADVRWEPVRVIKDTDTKKAKKSRKDIKVKEKLFLNGIEFETTQKMKKISDYEYEIVIPNDSPLLKAQDLQDAIAKHSTKSGDFDKEAMKKLDLSGQVGHIFNYLKTKIKLSHVVYYEGIMHALIKDANDLTSRLTENTTLIEYTHANQILTKPERTSSISNILPHGYFKNTMNTVKLNDSPSESDILYSSLGPRTMATKNINKELNRSLMANTDNLYSKKQI